MENDRLFIGSYPCGIVYADKHNEEHGDYKRLAFLPYDGMELKFEKDCPEELKERIRKSATYYEGKETLQVSTCGQTVQLRWDDPEKGPKKVLRKGQECNKKGGFSRLFCGL